MSAWALVKLEMLCTPAERFIAPVPSVTYRQLGVRLWGAGAYEREQIDGADTKYSNFNRIDADDLVINKIWARNGAVAVATSHQAGTYVSTEFPTFVLHQTKIDPQWMRYITQWRGFWKACDDKAQGTSGKNRIKPGQFLSIEIPLPTIPQQRVLVSRLDALAEMAGNVEGHLDSVERDATQLLALHLSKVVSGVPLRPLIEVAPSIRRPLEIDAAQRYKEVGARSFGKGLFSKPDFEGAKATWQKPVWIKSGDLVLSNIKAWEGAIAPAGSEHDGCIASHRYITCVPDPALATANFLAFYLLSEEGLEKVGIASPGTADRNRTLSLTNLRRISVPVPPLSSQKAFDRLLEDFNSLRVKHASIRKACEALIPATLERLFARNAVAQV